jgi:hypothetical protein
MNQIKFSHDYFKFAGLQHATAIEHKLLHVFVENTSNFGKDFIDYDTTFYNDATQEKGKYELPKGKVLVLFFFAGYDDVFTTVRRWTPEKEKYYKNAVGQMFKVVIE